MAVPISDPVTEVISIQVGHWDAWTIWHHWGRNGWRQVVQFGRGLNWLQWWTEITKHIHNLWARAGRGEPRTGREDMGTSTVAKWSRGRRWSSGDDPVALWAGFLVPTDTLVHLLQAEEEVAGTVVCHGCCGHRRGRGVGGEIRQMSGHLH